jgi:ATP-dependent protease ClpP protease subunit
MIVIEINKEIGIWGFSSDNLKSVLDGASEDLEIRLDSPGGSVFEGIKIYNLLKKYNKGKVVIVIGAMCASIATYIAMAGDEIKVHDNSSFMIHNAWTYASGDYREMYQVAKVLEGLTSLIAKKYIHKTKKSKKTIQEAMNDESWFFGSEIKEYGFADVVINSDTQEEQNKSEALALASERYSACVKKMIEKEIDEKKEIAALVEGIECVDGVCTTAGSTSRDLKNEHAQKALKIAEKKLNLHEKEIL